MEEWKEYKIEETSIEMIDGDRGKNYPKNDEFFTEGYCLFLNAGNVTKNGFSFSENSFITREKDDALRKGRLDRYDVVITTRGTVGNVALYDMNVPFEHVRINSGMLILKSGKDIMPEYLYYYLKGITFQTQISQYVSGSAQPQLPKGTLAKMSVSYPYNKDTQKRIIAILKSLDDKIEVNRRINENLEQQAQALFKSWFVDFEPFKNQPFVESELGMIPHGWSIDNIYKYVDVIYGAPYKSSLFNEKKEGLPLIRIRDLKTNSPQVYTSETLPTTEYIEAGDIVAGMDAEFVPCVWLGERGVLNQRCCKFKAKNPSISNYYILFLLKPELEYVQSYKTGTTVSHLGKSDIDRFRFITPPIDVIIPFSRRVDALLKEKVAIAQESRCLAELRDTLLPRLMSGELKVNDLENNEI